MGTPVLAFAGPEALGDAGAFVARVARLDRQALVRIVPVPGGPGVRLWARLPYDVLAGRSVATDAGDRGVVEDATVGAADLLDALTRARAAGTAALALPARRDAAWRGWLPADSGWRVVERVPAEVVRALVDAGQSTVRSAPDPTRAGEAVLDHESLTVTGDDITLAVPYRLLHAAVQMGFVAAGGDSGTPVVEVAVTPAWVRLAGVYGTVYRRRTTPAGGGVLTIG
ncbi:MAG: hypothetical protein ACJ73S_24690 [Mycobacteriales bacterium]